MGFNSGFKGLKVLFFFSLSMNNISGLLKSTYYHYYICYHLYAGDLQLYTSNKPCFQFIQCCSCSVFTICATCNVILQVKYDLSLYVITFHRMCAVPTVVFLQFLDFMLSFYVALVLSELPFLFTSTTQAFIFHMRRISIVRSLYFRIFSAPF